MLGVFHFADDCLEFASFHRQILNDPITNVTIERYTDTLNVENVAEILRRNNINLSGYG